MLSGGMTSAGGSVGAVAGERGARDEAGVGFGPWRLTPVQSAALSPELAQAGERDKRPQDENGGGEVDQPEVPERGESVGIVRRDGDRQCDDRNRNGANPGPDIPAADSEPSQEGGRQPGRRDKARKRDVEVPDVVVELRAESEDLVAPYVDLFGADPNLEELAGEVADEEPDGVNDEGDRSDHHHGATELELQRLLADQAGGVGGSSCHAGSPLDRGIPCFHPCATPRRSSAALSH